MNFVKISSLTLTRLTKIQGRQARFVRVYFFSPAESQSTQWFTSVCVKNIHRLTDLSWSHLKAKQ